MFLKYMFQDVDLVCLSWSGFVPLSPQLTAVTLRKRLKKQLEQNAGLHSAKCNRMVYIILAFLAY